MAKIIFMCVTIFIISMTSCGFADSSLLGLTPEQISEISRRDQERNRDNNALLLNILIEKQRIDRERAQNPYIDCTLLGNVEGATMDGAKEIAIQMGANSIRWINVSKDKTTAQAYKCP